MAGDENIPSLRKTFRFCEEFRYVASRDYQNSSRSSPMDLTRRGEKKNCPVIVSPCHPFPLAGMMSEKLEA